MLVVLVAMLLVGPSPAAQRVLAHRLLRLTTIAVTMTAAAARTITSTQLDPQAAAAIVVTTATKPLGPAGVVAAATTIGTETARMHDHAMMITQLVAPADTHLRATLVRPCCHRHLSLRQALAITAMDTAATTTSSDIAMATADMLVAADSTTVTPGMAVTVPVGAHLAVAMVMTIVPHRRLDLLVTMTVAVAVTKGSGGTTMTVAGMLVRVVRAATGRGRLR